MVKLYRRDLYDVLQRPVGERLPWTPYLGGAADPIGAYHCTMRTVISKRRPRFLALVPFTTGLVAISLFSAVADDSAPSVERCNALVKKVDAGDVLSAEDGSAYQVCLKSGMIQHGSIVNRAVHDAADMVTDIGKMLFNDRN